VSGTPDDFFLGFFVAESASGKELSLVGFLEDDVFFLTAFTGTSALATEDSSTDPEL